MSIKNGDLPEMPNEEAFSKGFFLECKDGDLISENLPGAQRRKWGKRVSPVRVFLPNKNKLFLQDFLNKAFHERKERIRYNHDGLYYHYDQIVKSLQAIIEKERDENCEWMNPNEYEEFYSKGIAHKVDMCRSCFFSTYPNAIRR